MEWFKLSTFFLESNNFSMFSFSLLVFFPHFSRALKLHIDFCSHSFVQTTSTHFTHHRFTKTLEINATPITLGYSRFYSLRKCWPQNLADSFPAQKLFVFFTLTLAFKCWTNTDFLRHYCFIPTNETIVDSEEFLRARIEERCVYFSYGVHGNVWQLLAQQQRLHFRIGHEAFCGGVQFDAGGVAAARDGIDHYSVVYICHSYDDERAWHFEVKYGIIVISRVLIKNTKQAKNWSKICVLSFNIELTFCSSVSLSMSPTIKEVSSSTSLPPALPPKKSRSIKLRTPPPISPKPKSNVQTTQALDPIVTSTPIKSKEATPISDKKDVNSVRLKWIKHIPK